MRGIRRNERSPLEVEREKNRQGYRILKTEGLYFNRASAIVR